MFAKKSHAGQILPNSEKFKFNGPEINRPRQIEKCMKITSSRGPSCEKT